MGKFNNVATSTHKFLQFKDSWSRSLWKNMTWSQCGYGGPTKLPRQKALHYSLRKSKLCHFLDGFKNPHASLLG